MRKQCEKCELLKGYPNNLLTSKQHSLVKIQCYSWFMELLIYLRGTFIPYFIYKFRRKRIGVLATQRWGKSLPKFNSPETKQQLAEFATEITPECGIPEINFGEDGIARHIQTFFSEQRRYQKNKKTQTPCKVCYIYFFSTQMQIDQSVNMFSFR